MKISLIIVLPEWFTELGSPTRPLWGGVAKFRSHFGSRMEARTVLDDRSLPVEPPGCTCGITFGNCWGEDHGAFGAPTLESDQCMCGICFWREVVKALLYLIFGRLPVLTIVVCLALTLLILLVQVVIYIKDLLPFDRTWWFIIIVSYFTPNTREY